MVIILLALSLLTLTKSYILICLKITLPCIVLLSLRFPAPLLMQIARISTLYIHFPSLFPLLISISGIWNGILWPLLVEPIYLSTLIPLSVLPLPLTNIRLPSPATAQPLVLPIMVIPRCIVPHISNLCITLLVSSPRRMRMRPSPLCPPLLFPFLLALLLANSALSLYLVSIISLSWVTALRALARIPLCTLVRLMPRLRNLIWILAAMMHLPLLPRFRALVRLQTSLFPVTSLVLL